MTPTVDQMTDILTAALTANAMALRPESGDWGEARVSDLAAGIVARLARPATPGSDVNRFAETIRQVMRGNPYATSRKNGNDALTALVARLATAGPDDDREGNVAGQHNMDWWAGYPSQAAGPSEREARLSRLLRQAAINYHDFGRGHQPGPSSTDADKRVFFSHCQQDECVEARAALTEWTP